MVPEASLEKKPPEASPKEPVSATDKATSEKPEPEKPEKPAESPRSPAKDSKPEGFLAFGARILDGKLAPKTARLSGQQIFRQADTALAAQANKLSQGVLALSKTNFGLKPPPSGV